MMLSKKQELYLEIMEWLLPATRNVQTWGVYQRVFRGNVYEELELIHNLPSLSKNSDIELSDLHWLNTQACNYLAATDGVLRHHSEMVKNLIVVLLKHVPKELEHEITRQPIKDIFETIKSKKSR